jgi:hypothetical protein
MDRSVIEGVPGRYRHPLADGRCLECGTPCAGVFEAARGHWGRRCRAISV